MSLVYEEAVVTAVNGSYGEILGRLPLAGNTRTTSSHKAAFGLLVDYRINIY